MYYSLLGIDGNPYYVMGYVSKAMKESGKSKAGREAYFADAMSSDYNHLLDVSLRMVDLLNRENGCLDGDESDNDDDL